MLKFVLTLAPRNKALPFKLLCYRSSSLVVPPSTPQSESRRSQHSPGSKSLHLSPQRPPKENFGKGKRGSSASPVTSTAPEMFTFPPISDSGESAPMSSRLSSVLHVQDSNLSSDDFHEALFFDRSPKSAKKRRRSRRILQLTQKRDCHDDAKDASTPGSGKKSIKSQQQPSHICAH